MTQDTDFDKLHKLNIQGSQIKLDDFVLCGVRAFTLSSDPGSGLLMLKLEIFIEKTDLRP